MARVSHTDSPSWIRHGTRIEEDRISSSARDSASSTNSTSNGRPDIRVNSQPRSDQDE